MNRQNITTLLPLSYCINTISVLLTHKFFMWKLVWRHLSYSSIARRISIIAQQSHQNNAQRLPNKSCNCIQEVSIDEQVNILILLTLLSCMHTTCPRNRRNKEKLNKLFHKLVLHLKRHEKWKLFYRLHKIKYEITIIDSDLSKCNHICMLCGWNEFDGKESSEEFQWASLN